jgi:1,2-phenylacetyl-CoA epoxidase catalytic subunit
MFREFVERKNIDRMDPEYKALLSRVLMIQADCEIGGPHLYTKDILPSAATKIDQLIVARVAGDIGVDVSFVLTWSNQNHYLNAFRGIIKTWEDFAVFGFLSDRVGRYQLEEFFGCTYKPLTRILPTIVKEEIGHIGYGTAKTAELASKGDESREKVQRVLNFWYAKALDMFGRSDSERDGSNRKP